MTKGDIIKEDKKYKEIRTEEDRQKEIDRETVRVEQEVPDSSVSEAEKTADRTELSPDEQPVFDTDPDSSIELVYGIEEHPKSIWETLFYAFQITLVDFTPFIWAGMFVSIAGLEESVIATMIRTCFLAMGIATLIQTTIGNRLPIVQGPSSSVLTAMGNVTAVYGFAAMWGAVLVGGALEFLIGKAKILGKLRRFIPAVVTGSVVTVIGFVATRISITWIFTKPNAMDLSLALVAFLLAIILKFKGKGIMSSGFVLFTVLIVGVIGASLVGRYNWASVAEAPLFSLPTLFPFQGHGGEESPFVILGAAVLVGFTGYIGSMFESLGDYAATCAVSKTTYRVKHINKGITAEGLGCVASGLLGALPVTSYTQNIGIIAATGVASRRITQVAAVIFLFYGLSPKLAAMLAAIPRPVVGGVFLISAALIMFSGIEVIASEKRNTANNLIAGVTIGCGVMVPTFATGAWKEWVAGFSDFGRMFVTSNIFIAVVVGIVMNLLIHHFLKAGDEN